MEPAGKQEVIRLQFRLLDPHLQGLSGDCRDLELNWALGLVLHDDRSRGHLVTMGHVTDLECNEVAFAKLAVDAEVEACELLDPAIHLKTYAQSSDVLHLEGCLLPDDLAFVPRLVMSRIA